MRFATKTLILLCISCIGTGTGCKRLVKDETMDVACARTIKDVSKLLEDSRAELDKTVLRQSENLLSAARIDQQFKRYAECFDKGSRAQQLITKQETEK